MYWWYPHHAIFLGYPSTIGDLVLGSGRLRLLAESEAYGRLTWDNWFSQSSENKISQLRKFTCGRCWPLGGGVLGVGLVG